MIRSHDPKWGSGKFGGTIRTLFTVDEEMFEEKDIDEVKFDAGVNFMNMIKARLGFNYGNEAGFTHTFDKSKIEFFFHSFSRYYEKVFAFLRGFSNATKRAIFSLSKYNITR